MNNLIYLDNGATTKPSIEALEKASKINLENYFNASALYQKGVQSKNLLEEARKNISNCVGNNFEVIFTSCGTESDNTAIYSYLKRGNAITTLGEHSAVHNTFLEFQKNGFDVRFAKLNEDGSVNVEELLKLVDEKTTFVSVVHVNNETGAINDINYIAKRIKQINDRVIFHSDGVQAFMKIPYNLSENIDLYSVSAHKINGLKGVGCILKNKNLKNLKPLIIGGGQEGGLRSGTENLFGIKVFEYACVNHFKNLTENYNKVFKLKEIFIENLDKSIFKIISSDNCSPYIISLSGVGLRGEVLMRLLESDGVIIGTGSACSSKHKHSRMLKEIGYNTKILDGVIRVSFSYENTIDEVIYAVHKLNERGLQLKRTINK